MRSNAVSRFGDYPRLIGAIALAILLYGLATLAGWTIPPTIVAAHAGPASVESAPPVWAVFPFVLLLGAIAILPLWQHSSHWWESNRNKLVVAMAAALLTLVYFVMLHPSGGWEFTFQTLEHVVANDYIPFMVLLFSLFTICGGIRISGDLPAHPLTNSIFIAVGGLLASLIGTTGAAMLLVRVLIETNSQRRHQAHTIVFFIIVACNCGGLLLPIGDPPLFLGYLKGVDFLWTLNLWRSWLFINGVVLGCYYLLDHFVFYRRERPADIVRDETAVRRLTFEGVWPNALWLLGVVLAVALLDPSKPIPGTSWRPWLYLREAVQLALVALSLVFGRQDARRGNRFGFAPILEVAALFIGIFVAMQPALQLLDARGGSLGVDTPARFFWFSGWLSAVLDNAPTYLVFFETARIVSAGQADLVGGVAHDLLVGISLGSVTMGAMTYIGNGPNFMVKTIAEQSGIRMPSFFGYLGYSVAVLLPVLVLHNWLFLP
ncbi:MAG TPA: sodium:proton antiporter [Pirellulales bacterium]|jgi:Na+/H+ antiporter NhaD/arsenite permease-like protein|nr:sodium:proton antiporter [Pirellulales bacterium]